MAHRKGRSALTAGGIVLGVAIFFGVLVANATIQEGVDDLIEDFTGRADVIVSPPGAFDATMPADVLDRVRDLPDVRFASGTYGVPVRLTRDARNSDGLLRGVRLDDLASIQNIEYREGGGFDPEADQIVLGPNRAETLLAEVGDEVVVSTSDAERTMTVTGILANTGAGRADGGHVAYAPLTTLREVTDAGAVFSRLNVVLSGADPDAWIAAHADELPAVRLQNAETLAQGFRDFLATFGAVLTFFAAIALFVGAFLIYLTLSTAIVERTQVYGTLRAMGATRAQVRRLVLTEATTLGAVSTLVGLGLGLLIAMGLLMLMAGILDLRLPGLVVTPTAVVAGVVVGLLVTVASAVLPATRAGRLAPVTAMKGDHAAQTRLGRAWIAGLIILGVSVVLQLMRVGGDDQAVGSLWTLTTLLGAVLLVPAVLRPLAALVGRLTHRFARGVGDIAVLHLVKERSRSAYTLALVMVVMAMLFTTGGLYLSVAAAVDEVVEAQFGADLFLEGNRVIDGEIGEVLRSREDVRALSGIRFGETTLAGPTAEDPSAPSELFVPIIDPESYFDITSFLWADGDDASARTALIAGEAVLLPDALAEQFGAPRGGTITLETSEGPTSFEIAGTYIAPPGPPEVVVGLPDGRRYFGATEPMAFIVDVPNELDPEVVKSSIFADLEDPNAVEITTAGEQKEQARAEISSYFQVLWAILLVAGIVGLLGLANTLAMSVLRRFREIGILRSLGVTRSEIWRMVLVESTTMGLAAFVLSIPLGWALTTFAVRDVASNFGFTMPTVYPWTWVPGVLVFGILVAVLAAVAPGRRAARLEVVGALQYE